MIRWLTSLSRTFCACVVVLLLAKKTLFWVMCCLLNVSSGLDMKPFLGTPCGADGAMYDLYSVINHHGGILGGHYTAYGRCEKLHNDAEEVGQ